MIERIIENWLDNSSELSFQKPFCYYLISNGYTIIHVSRHCGMELGKDIIAKSPTGEYCAYQLKSGKIGIKQWRTINSQIIDLVTLSPAHPSIDSIKIHKSFLVTNGEIEEEVQRAINDLNQGWINSGQKQYKLHTIVRGELLDCFKSLQNSLWPSELTNIKGFLELFLSDGRAQLPREKFCIFLESILPIKANKKPKKVECQRYLSSAGLIYSIITSNYTSNKNHVSEIKAWTIYIAYLFYLVEKWNLEKKYWISELEIAKAFIFNSLNTLSEEVNERTHFAEGNYIVDQPFSQVRITLLVALLSVFALWNILNNKGQNDDTNNDGSIQKFCLKYSNKLYLWGEGAIPQFLAFFWYHRWIDPGIRPFFIIRDLITLISKYNHQQSNSALANPYYDVTDIFSNAFGLADEPIEDSFRGSSYYLESLFQLFVRHEWKREAKSLWKEFSKINIHRFEYKNRWDIFRWRNEEGVQVTELIKPRQTWTRYLKKSQNYDSNLIPKSIKNYPVLMLLILIVYPFRIYPDLAKWLDDTLDPI